jgi:hypothetical protein
MFFLLSDLGAVEVYWCFSDKEGVLGCPLEDVFFELTRYQ